MGKLKSIKPLNTDGRTFTAVRRIKLHGVDRRHVDQFVSGVVYPAAVVAVATLRALNHTRNQLDDIEEAVKARGKKHAYKFIEQDDELVLIEVKPTQMSAAMKRIHLDNRIEQAIIEIDALRKIQADLEVAAIKRYADMAEPSDVVLQPACSSLYDFARRNVPFLFPPELGVYTEPQLLIDLRHTEGPSVVNGKIGRRVKYLFDTAMYSSLRHAIRSSPEDSDEWSRQDKLDYLENEVAVVTQHGECIVHYDRSFYRLVICTKTMRVIDVFATQVRPDIMETLYMPKESK